MIVSACSNRKRLPADPRLKPDGLVEGSLQDVAREWRSLIATAITNKQDLHAPKDVYCGRSFSDAAWSAGKSGMPHYVISAGLGVVRPDDWIPAYALTTVGSTSENILAKCPAGVRPADWWRAAFPDNTLAKTINAAEGRVCLALPSVYLEMIHEDLLQINDRGLAKIRIFTGASGSLRGSRLSQNILPYDGRLDGPESSLPGTKSDFASRALRHFVGLTINQPVKELAEDIVTVERALAFMSKPALPVRERKSDGDIRAELIAVWASVNGNRQKLLRHLRDKLLISCEQSRFSRIARDLENEGLV